MADYIDTHSGTSVFPVSLTLLIDRTFKVKFKFNVIAGCQDPRRAVKVQSATISQTGLITITLDQRLVPLEDVFPLGSRNLQATDDLGCQAVSANVAVDGVQQPLLDISLDAVMLEDSKADDYTFDWECQSTGTDLQLQVKFTNPDAISTAYNQGFRFDELTITFNGFFYL